MQGRIFYNKDGRQAGSYQPILESKYPNLITREFSTIFTGTSQISYSKTIRYIYNDTYSLFENISASNASSSYHKVGMKFENEYFVGIEMKNQLMLFPPMGGTLYQIGEDVGINNYAFVTVAIAYDGEFTISSPSHAFPFKIYSRPKEG